VRAYEFISKLTPEGKLELPREVLAILPVNQMIKVILLVDELANNVDKDAWATLAAEQFVSGYSEPDSIYDSI
jgi:hypothetical protein